MSGMKALLLLGSGSPGVVLMAEGLASIPTDLAKGATEQLQQTTLGAVIIVGALFMAWLIYIIGQERKAAAEEREKAALRAQAKDDKTTAAMENLTAAIREALTADKISERIADRLHSDSRDDVQRRPRT